VNLQKILSSDFDFGLLCIVLRAISLTDRNKFRYYCDINEERAITTLRNTKQLISVTMIVHATEEHVTSAVASRNNRGADGNGVATRSYTIGCEVDTRAGLDDVEKRKFLTLPGLELPTSRSPSP
jgi:hypothetical protein